MSNGIDANALRELLGDATGIAVRSSHKYLTRTGLELVPHRKPLGDLQARVFYRGAETSLLYPVQTGWSYGDAGKRHRFSTLVGAVLYVACLHIETPKPRR